MDRPAGYLLHKYLKDPLLLESGRMREGEKEKVRCSYELGDELTTCPVSVHCARRQKHNGGRSYGKKKYGEEGSGVPYEIVGAILQLPGSIPAKTKA